MLSGLKTGGVTGDAEQNEDDNEVDMKDGQGDGEGEVAAPATQGAPDQEQGASLGRCKRFHSIKNFLVRNLFACRCHRCSNHAERIDT